MAECSRTGPPSNGAAARGCQCEAGSDSELFDGEDCAERDEKLLPKTGLASEDIERLHIFGRLGVEGQDLCVEMGWR